MPRSLLTCSLALACQLPLASAAAQSDDRVLAARQQQIFLDRVDDAIGRANGRDVVVHLPPIVRRDDRWSGSDTLSTIFLRFFGNTVPNRTGIERPAPDDHPIEEYEVRLGDRVSYVLMGSANNHLLTPLHFYQQYDGIHALRYDLVPYESGSPIRLAVAGSPLYGSITTLARHGGVESDERLPLSVLVGGAAGLDAWTDGRFFGVHARAWALPGVDVLDGRAGVSTLESVQVKWHLTDTLDGDRTWPLDLGILALHLDRGDARSSVYAWSGDTRSPAELRDLWQATVFVELRVD